MDAPRSEAIVQAGANDVGVEVGARTEHRRAAAQIDVEIFGLDAPRAGDAVFEAAAEGPADFGIARPADAGDVGLDVAERGAAGHVRQEAAERVAEPPARGAQPVVARLTRRSGAGRAAADVAPVDVAFEAEHGLVHLPVIAERAADQTARCIE